MILGTARVFTLVSRANLVDLKRDGPGLLVVRHVNLPRLQQRCTLVRPRDDRFWISSHATFENCVSTLRESGVFEYLFEDRRRWIAGSAGKSEDEFKFNLIFYELLNLYEKRVCINILEILISFDWLIFFFRNLWFDISGTLKFNFSEFIICFQQDKIRKLN